MLKRIILYAVLLFSTLAAGVTYVQHPNWFDRSIYLINAYIAGHDIHCTKDSDALKDILKKHSLMNFSLTGKIIHITSKGKIHECYVSKAFPQGDFTFRFASMTKALTTFAILDLVDQQEFNLNDRVLNFFPEVELSNLRDPRVNNITIQHLLSHSSGLGGAWGSDNMLNKKEKSWCPYNIKQVERVRLAGPPGSNYLYTNISYCILGEIISRNTGINFKDHIHSQYLKNYSSLKFIHGPFLASEVIYDFTNEYRFTPNYIDWLDFHALAAAAGLYGSPLEFTQLIWNLHQKDPSRIFKAIDHELCENNLTNKCYSNTFEIFFNNNIKIAAQQGYMPGASSMLALDNKGNVVVWVAAGAAINDKARNTISSQIVNLLRKSI